MPSVDELFDQMEEQGVEVYAQEQYCVIDADTRTITVQPEYQLLGVENDKKVERLYFQCPKIVGDNIDLSTGFQLFICFENAGNEADAYHIDDMQVEADNITFSWLLGEAVTRYQGNVQFAFCAIKPGEEGEPDLNRWNTTINNECICLIGLKSTEIVEEQNADAIAQLWDAISQISTGGSGGTNDYDNLQNKPKINNVELTGNKTADELNLQHKGNYLTQETDPTVPQWAKSPTKPSYTATEVGADASGTAVAKVSEHNTAADAHSDIRLLVQGLTDRLNTLADSDDDTLDQMSEIVAYIKSNKTLIDAITTNKVSVADIVDNLTTNVSNKPLSAAQGVALKALIDGIVIPETLPNPQKLKFTGAVTAEYDGSTEQTVNIPDSTGGGSYTLSIMSDTQLGGGKAVSKTDEDVPVAVDPETGQLYVPPYPESGETTVQQMQNTDTTVTLQPNILYIFPEMTTLDVTIPQTDQEIHFFFDSGATATTFSLQAQGGGKIYTDAYSIDANMRYEVSVLHNVAYIKGVSMSET